MLREFREEPALHVASAVNDVVDGSCRHPHRERTADEDPVTPAPHKKRNHGACGERQRKHPAQFFGEFERVGFLPAGKRRYAQQEQHREHQGAEDGIKVRGAHRNLASAQSVQEEGVKRPQKDGAHRNDEKHVVHEQHRLARHHGEIAPQPHRRRAPRKKEERQADHDDEECQNEDAALRIRREGVHGRQYAGTHEECSQERKRKCDDCKKHRPNLEAPALFRDGQAV